MTVEFPLKYSAFWEQWSLNYVKMMKKKSLLIFIFKTIFFLNISIFGVISLKIQKNCFKNIIFLYFQLISISMLICLEYSFEYDFLVHATFKFQRENIQMIQ